MSGLGVANILCLVLDFPWGGCQFEPLKKGGRGPDVRVLFQSSLRTSDGSKKEEACRTKIVLHNAYTSE